MAKRTGDLEIPPIAVGSEQSEPLRITVRQPANAPPGEADVFITSEVDYAESYVQAQVLYRIKVYRAVPPRPPALLAGVGSPTEERRCREDITSSAAVVSSGSSDASPTANEGEGRDDEGSNFRNADGRPFAASIDAATLSTLAHVWMARHFSTSTSCDDFADRLPERDRRTPPSSADACFAGLAFTAVVSEALFSSAFSFSFAAPPPPFAARSM